MKIDTEICTLCGASVRFGSGDKKDSARRDSGNGN